MINTFSLSALCLRDVDADVEIGAAMDKIKLPSEGSEYKTTLMSNIEPFKTHVSWLGSASGSHVKSQQSLWKRTCRLSRWFKVPFDWFRRVLQERLCPCSCRVTSCIRSNTHGVPNKPISWDTDSNQTLRQSTQRERSSSSDALIGWPSSTSGR